MVCWFRCDGRNLALLLRHGCVSAMVFQEEVDGHTEMSLELAPPLFVPMRKDHKINLAYNYSSLNLYLALYR